MVTKSNYFEADLINNFIIKKIKKLFLKKFHIPRNLIFIEFMKKFLQNKKYSDSFPFSRLKDALIVTKIIKTMINSNKQKKLINSMTKIIFILALEKFKGNKKQEYQKN